MKKFRNIDEMCYYISTLIENEELKIFLNELNGNNCLILKPFIIKVDVEHMTIEKIEVQML